MSYPGGSDAVAAEHPLGVGESRPVVDQEAVHASELVGLLGLDLHLELLVGQVGPGQLEGLRCLFLVVVDLAGVLVLAGRLQLIEGVFLGVEPLGLARSVVVGSDLGSLCRPNAVRAVNGARVSPTVASVPHVGPSRRHRPWPRVLVRHRRNRTSQKHDDELRWLLHPACRRVQRTSGGHGRFTSHRHLARTTPVCW